MISNLVYAIITIFLTIQNYSSRCQYQTIWLWFCCL